MVCVKAIDTQGEEIQNIRKLIRDKGYSRYRL